jgi:hypothetical protein
MASINNSRLLFFVTSPRSPIKIIEELNLLKDFEGKKWDKEAQEAYAEKLTDEIETFKPKKEHISFTARDRVNRAPKSLGFVDLSPVVSITDAGKEFLGNNREEIFLRQLLKFQLPSPYHKDKDNSFNVKPFLEIIRLIYDLGGLSKTELQIFGLQIISYTQYDSVRKKLIEFRKNRINITGGRKEYVRLVTISEFREIYSDELKTKKFRIRENLEESETKFIQTKINNAKDYADACFRYLLLTGLFVFDFKKRLLVSKQERKAEIEFILSTIPREATMFYNEKDFKSYLFNASEPQLFWDIESNVKAELKRLDYDIKSTQTLPVLKNKLNEIKAKNYKDRITTELNVIAEEKGVGEILDIYKGLEENSADIVDPNLFLEWNTWRAFVLLDDGKIDGNFIRDVDGYPISTAPGKNPDISCDYDDFGLIVEVTRSTGAKQFEMEGEPVPRHLGRAREKSKKPVYGIFIPITLNQSTLAYFYMLMRQNIPYYGGKAEIIPIQLDNFVSILAKAKGKIKSDNLKKFVETLIKYGKECESPEVWESKIKEACKIGIEV